MLDPARQPQTLEKLLERHWEQGSRFLMEQASHFDIASLLSSLHQLKEENLGLEDSDVIIFLPSEPDYWHSTHSQSEPEHFHQSNVVFRMVLVAGSDNYF